MRPILVAAARIDNLPKGADCRFCIKLHQRQSRNLLRDAHRSERVKKQVVQFHLSLLEKETCSDWKRFRKGSRSSGFRLSWRNNPVVWSLSLEFQRLLQKRGKNKKTPPVALAWSVAALLERPFENLASRRTASVLTGSRKFVDILGWTERAKSGFILQWWFASKTSLERARRERSGELSRDRAVDHLPNDTSTQLSLPRWSAVSSHRAWTHRVCLEWIQEREREREREREKEREREIVRERGRERERDAHSAIARASEK